MAEYKGYQLKAFIINAIAVTVCDIHVDEWIVGLMYNICDYHKQLWENFSYVKL
jgi:hypothetical protein